MSDQTIEQRLDEILVTLFDEDVLHAPDWSLEWQHYKDTRQALLQLLNEARIDEATHFVVLTDGVKHEVVYKQTQDEYLTKDERIAQLMENK